MLTRILAGFLTTGSGAITGNLAATDSADTIAVSGIVLVQGALAVTESGSDTFAGTGDASAEVIGNLSASESGTDTLSAAGAVRINGTLSAAESGADIFAGTGDASDIVFGNLNATESADGFAGVGRVDIIGSLAGMEVGADSILISGSSVRTGYLDATESGSDTFSATQPSVLTLTAADLAAIAAIVQGIVDAGVNVSKMNGATLYGSGTSSDKWRGTA